MVGGCTASESREVPFLSVGDVTTRRSLGRGLGGSSDEVEENEVNEEKDELESQIVLRDGEGVRR